MMGTLGCVLESVSLSLLGVDQEAQCAGTETWGGVRAVSGAGQGPELCLGAGDLSQQDHRSLGPTLSGPALGETE